jgi:hypothetical protein
MALIVHSSVLTLENTIAIELQMEAKSFLNTSDNILVVSTKLPPLLNNKDEISITSTILIFFPFFNILALEKALIIYCF